MGTVTHWVHKINWTMVISAGIIATGMYALADGIRDIQPDNYYINQVVTKEHTPTTSVIRRKADGTMEKIQ